MDAVITAGIRLKDSFASDLDLKVWPEMLVIEDGVYDGERLFGAVW